MTAYKYLSECLVSACLALMVLSCSIKEDRVGCPCFLKLDMSAASNHGPLKVNIIASDGSTCSSVFDPEEHAGQSLSEVVYRIPRGPAMLVVVAGDDGKFDDFSGVKIPLGDECPYIFMYASMLDAVGETCEEKVNLCKDYCRISVQMAYDEVMGYPYDVEIIGNIDGYSWERKPEEGDFRFFMPYSKTGIFHVNVPRQTGNSLVLRVTEDTEVLRDFAIGEYLDAAGYDWTAESLEDVELFIDFVKADVVLKVEEWEYSFSFDVVI